MESTFPHKLMLRRTSRCTVGAGFSDWNNRSIPFAFYFRSRSCTVWLLWLGILRNRSYVDARQLQQFFERRQPSLLASSSLIHALALPDRLAWSLILLMSEKVFYRILLDIHVWYLHLSSFSAKGFGRPEGTAGQNRLLERASTSLFKRRTQFKGYSNPLEKKKAAL